MAGITGVTTLSETLYRKQVLVAGNTTESFTITSGVSSGTSDTWSASEMTMKSLSWSVTPGTGADRHVALLWENSAIGSTHSTIWNCHDTGCIDFKSMGLAFKNNANIPTGNILVQSNLGASGAYSIMMEIGKPYGGIDH